MATKNGQKPAPVKVTGTPASVDWDSLPDAQDVAYFASSAGRSKIDREESTPAPVKARVAEAHSATVDNKGQAKFKLQPCGTADRAAEFLKLATAYAPFKFEGFSFRGKLLTDGEINKLVQMKALPPTTKPGTVVSFAVAKRTPRPEVSDEVKAERKAKRAANKAAKLATQATT